MSPGFTRNFLRDTNEEKISKDMEIRGKAVCSFCMNAPHFNTRKETVDRISSKLSVAAFLQQ